MLQTYLTPDVFQVSITRLVIDRLIIELTVLRLSAVDDSTFLDQVVVATNEHLQSTVQSK